MRLTSDGRAKLIDFGILVTAGVIKPAAGSPPAIASEVLQGIPVDHRADLYGLGTLAYLMLTHRHAYPARYIADLPDCWKRTPVAPSTVRDDVPAALDELVASILSHEPLARPVSAAEVIGRLEAIVDFAPSDRQVFHGYIASA
ncbi:MAG: hypothetical protein AAF654_12070 [Myxococcota bacterium]